MANSDASPITQNEHPSITPAFVANRYARMLERKNTNRTINFPSWVKTTRCTQRTGSFLVYTNHGTIRAETPVNVETYGKHHKRPKSNSLTGFEQSR